MADNNTDNYVEDQQNLAEDKTKIIKKYPVGSDVDKELIFNFPYILHDETVSYIQNNGRVMFIVRGPPSTGKATLSEMIAEKYPDAVYCCADKYFTNSFANAQRTRESLKASHTYCQMKVENACKTSAHTIIVQNTHIRKWEMQVYLDFAASYNYTVIMAITLYRFDCTPKALTENNTDGLDINYFRKRLAQWEDVLPMFTGWFVSPNDSLHILQHLLESLETLLCDGKFCRIFNAYDAGDILSYFKPRRLLCSIAGYLRSYQSMKNYYLSDKVQSSYGKCFSLTLIGYLISTTTVYGIVSSSCDTKSLFSKKEAIKENSYLDKVDGLSLSSNLQRQSQTVSFPKQQDLPEDTTVQLKDWEDSDKIDIATCSIIDMAQKDHKELNAEAAQQVLFTFSKAITDIYNDPDCDEYVQLDGDKGGKIYRLIEDVWLVKPQQKVELKSIFSGFYI